MNPKELREKIAKGEIKEQTSTLPTFRNSTW